MSPTKMWSRKRSGPLSLPAWAEKEDHSTRQERINNQYLVGILAFLALSYFLLPSEEVPDFVTAGLKRCASHNEVPSPGLHRAGQIISDRYVEGTPDVLIFNATVWTGAENGTETLYNASVLLSKGLVKSINPSQDAVNKGTERVNANGAWVTPGIVDMHSHAGQVTFPIFAATNSLVSHLDIVMPFSQAIDSFNTHDLALRLVTAGGTTTSLILPGSSSAMGGEAWAMKFRNTSQNSPTSMLVEPPFELSTGTYKRSRSWRNAKHALGENVSKTWKDIGGTREDTIYRIRAAYTSAAKKKDAQDDWCKLAQSLTDRKFAFLRWPFGARPSRNEYFQLGKYPPSELEEEILVDVLRHKVRIHVHAYESTDFDALMRISNEFQFPIASIQHAHEAWFSVNTLKHFYGGTPAIAMFATSSIYKHEAYRHSLFAPIILAEQGVPVIFKSDHPPAVDSRYLVAEAALGHHFGLATNIALMSVTSTPAKAIGLDHRVGFLLPGYDADVVIWQSHPLTLGAMPSQVYVDGIPQLESPALVPRPAKDQSVPLSANFSQQIQAAKNSHHGDVDLEPVWLEENVVFTNVSRYIYRKEGDLVQDALHVDDVIVIENGTILCAGRCEEDKKARHINLMGGAVSPGLTLYGTSLGLIEINEEPSTTDQDVSPLSLTPPTGAVAAAANGAVFGGKESLISLRAGITNAITPPMSSNIFKGYSMYISLLAPHRLHPGAMIEKEVAYHVSVGHAPIYPISPAGLQISTQIQAIYTLLMHDKTENMTPLEKTFRNIAQGQTILVVFVSSADQMATLIAMKKEVEAVYKSSVKMVFDGALEAYLIAEQIAEANIGVITRERGNPVTWDDRRALPGAPLSEDTSISALRKAGVTVGIGMTGSRASTSTLRFYLAYSMTDSTFNTTELDALALASTNLEKLLNVPGPEKTWVATEYGGLLEVGQSRVVALGRGDGTVSGY